MKTKTKPPKRKTKKLTESIMNAWLKKSDINLWTWAVRVNQETKSLTLRIGTYLTVDFKDLQKLNKLLKPTVLYIIPDLEVDHDTFGNSNASIFLLISLDHCKEWPIPG